MATTTTVLGLTKPDTTDYRDISVINTNMDLIDTAVGNIRNVGAANAGKFMVVANDGTVTPTTVPFANGGTY